jgi:hypothetical protein
VNVLQKGITKSFTEHCSRQFFIEKLFCYTECTLSQALIKDKRNPNLSILAASQTKDKTILTEDGVGAMLTELRKHFEYIVCDSPAGIESGAKHAMYFSGEPSPLSLCALSAIVAVTNCLLCVNRRGDHLY